MSLVQHKEMWSYDVFKIHLKEKPTIAFLAGLFLVIMEVLNEYGAVQYFNFKTFTSEFSNSIYSSSCIGNRR